MKFQILARILSLVPRSDRNNARLVCKRWHRTLCNITERLVVRDMYALHMTDVFQGLNNIERRFRDLEFHRTRFRKVVTSFWTKSGSRLRSLEFHECDVPASMLKEILEHCTRLQSFKFQLLERDIHPDCDPMPAFISVLDHLIERKHAIPTVRSLEFNVFKYTRASVNVVARFFRVFPNVTELRVSAKETRSTNIDEYFGTLQKLVSDSAEKLEVLSLGTYFGEWWNQIATIPKLTG